MAQDNFLEVERCRDVLAPFTAHWRELAAEADEIDAGWLHGFGALYAPSGWSITPVRYFGVNNPDGIATAPLLGQFGGS